jgi:hypothetical protein
MVCPLKMNNPGKSFNAMSQQKARAEARAF